MFDVVVNHQRAHSERRANIGLRATDHAPTPGSGGGDDAGQTVDEANVVDWRAVPNGTAERSRATAERMTPAEERSRGVKRVTSCATGHQMYNQKHANTRQMKTCKH